MPRYKALYIERRALGFDHANALARRFADRPVIPIDSYHEVFSRTGQDFQAQKRYPALVAAFADTPRLYETPARACSLTGLPVYYNDQLRNCRYNCDYCFLQGAHASAHTLVFVNSADFHTAARARARDGDYWLSISYLTDMPAFEPVLPLTSEWISFAAANPGVTVEIRTKGGLQPFHRTAPIANVVLTWTLTPELIAQQHEHGCAPLVDRLRAVLFASRRGWRTRIAIDPVLLIPGWEPAYTAMLEMIFAELPAGTVEAASYGVFRAGTDYVRSLRAARADVPLLHHPFSRCNGTMSYDDREIATIRRIVGGPLAGALGHERVFFVHEHPEG